MIVKLIGGPLDGMECEIPQAELDRLYGHDFPLPLISLGAVEEMDGPEAVTHSVACYREGEIGDLLFSHVR